MKTWLVFWTWYLHDPTVIMGPQASERSFENRQECIEFVKTVSHSNGFEIVDHLGYFQFSSIDGMVFKGGCIQNTEEFDKLQIQVGLI